ncbi:hypothetical protein Fmac_012229 [Flemingia macrophylla]|uniref:Uncharacterized protein n=1 Tax=Flemingia macrophylla TaxID=520843 RepID=A0ABD1MPN9_9FABA
MAVVVVMVAETASKEALVMSKLYMRRQMCNVVACEEAERMNRHETLGQNQVAMTSHIHHDYIELNEKEASVPDATKVAPDLNYQDSDGYDRCKPEIATVRKPSQNRPSRANFATPDALVLLPDTIVIFTVFPQLRTLANPSPMFHFWTKSEETKVTRSNNVP